MMVQTPFSLEDQRARSLAAGCKLAHPQSGEEVVITGLSGSFPDSNNLYEFRDKLFNKVDLVSDDGRRYVTDHPEIPKRCGKLYTLNKFDAGFFGVHFKQADTMDPMGRIMLEKTYEAIVDSGYNPFQLRGRRCGVFIGACFSETEKSFYYENTSTEGMGAVGCARAVMAHKISYWLGVNGPSYTVDSACSSSLYALDHAYNAIRNGDCDMAIVGGANLCLHPYVSLQFSRLGVLSLDGASKSFDNRANGYCRAEAIPMIFLQKKKDARRIYATVVHSKTNCDGYKELGLTYPSGEMQLRLFEEFYEECGVDPEAISYIEAHGTGTKVGDPEECNALDKMFCKNRREPLLIGSVKSNMGHSEPAAGLASVAKIIVCMESGKIPPNLHYGIPRDGVPGFVEGRLKAVTESTKLRGGYIGTNSFGFGGANGHVLLKWNEKEKIKKPFSKDDLARLVCVSGRTEEAVNYILEDLESREVDDEYIKLYQELHSSEIPGHRYKGFTVLSGTRDVTRRHVQYCSNEKQPLWLVFSGVGSQWTGMGKTFLKISLFAATIEKCRNVLAIKGVDLLRILIEDEPKCFDNILNTLVAITSIQIGFVDVISSLGIVQDGCIGYSIGELAQAYMEGYLSLEQAVLISYYTGLSALETRMPEALTARVFTSRSVVKRLLIDGVELAGIEGPKTYTIAGTTDAMNKVFDKLEAKGIKYKIIRSCRIGFHTSLVEPMKNKLKSYLDKVIVHPKVKKQTPHATYSSGYFTNMLAEVVDFGSVEAEIPAKAVVLEVSPKSLLAEVLRGAGIRYTDVFCMNEDENSSTEDVLSGLGRLYEHGVSLQLDKLYPPVSYPVSRGTPMISPLIKWDHSKNWFVSKYKMAEKINWGERRVIVKMDDEDMEFMMGHVIDGRNLFPATGYLVMVWDTLARTLGVMYERLPVVFKRVRFDRATSIPKDGTIEFTITVQKGSGKFEVVEGGVAVVTGVILAPDKISKHTLTLPNRQQSTENIQLTAKDIYKELRLRGYQYTGLFKGLVSFNPSGTLGQVTWANNWIAFMDNLLQAQILSKDSRNLYVPTAIEKLMIDPVKHLGVISELGDKKEINVAVYPHLKVIECGGIQITDLQASQIPRRKQLTEPVLERYTFQQHISASPTDSSVEDIIGLCTHLALENVPGVKVKVIELGDETLSPDSHLLAPHVATILCSLPLIQADVTIYSSGKNPSVKNVETTVIVEDKKLSADHEALFVLGTQLTQKKSLHEGLFQAVKPGGFVISRERVEDELDLSGLNIVVDRRTKDERIIMFNSIKEERTEIPTVVKISQDEQFSWLPTLREEIKNGDNGQILLVAEDGPSNGIIGLVNCLRQESGSERIRCVFIMDPNAPTFSLTDKFYSEQLSKSLAMNVYKDGHWGSYRYQLLHDNKTHSVEHVYLNNSVKGDLSSIRWTEGPLNANNKLLNDPRLVSIYYSSVNFRDVMMFSGKLSSDTITSERLKADLVTGFEYVGRDQSGRRVMGMVTAGATASLVLSDAGLTWEVPEHWTLEDAATVPIVYGTALYALKTNGRMKEGDSVLIHSGTGGVGLAAITLAFHYGCTVFTTVGTSEKREYLKELFPQLADENIGNSRDTTFEDMVLRRTQGRGVDLVLNSLSGDKMKASLRCLAPGGRFLEIGKFDLVNNTPLSMEALSQCRSFHGVMLDTLFTASDSQKQEFHQLLQNALDSGCIVPLRRTVFNADDAEQAIRFMTTGKHIGKVLIKIREEEEQLNVKASKLLLKAAPKFYCDPEGTYVIIGGLGGFGLEVADWLVLRGARRIVLSSRTGVRSGYQVQRIKTWERYGVKVVISTEDVTKREGVERLLSSAGELKPVAGIFNLAVVLKDAIFENMGEEDFKTSFLPKAVSTNLLDEFSRKLCPNLQHFVVFSSVSCGRGNAGQTNYGMANSVMERICEERVQEGLPGLAIQWGAVGDVGLVADMQEEHKELVVGGTLQQPITSCLQCLDVFMKQDCPVVAAMVVAEKRSTVSGSGGLVNTVAGILGIRDMNTVSMHSTLAEVGMDSMMAVDIKQTLEREFDVFLTAQDIRALTFAKLVAIASKETPAPEEKMEKLADIETEPVPKEKPKLIQEAAPATTTARTTAETAPTTKPAPGSKRDTATRVSPLQYLLRLVGDELLLSQTHVELSHKPGDDFAFLIPGLEGSAAAFETLAKDLDEKAVCLQIPTDPRLVTMTDLAQPMVEIVLKYPSDNYKVIGYSLGSMIALELTRLLESLGKKITLYLIDGSPTMLKHLCDNDFYGKNEHELQVQLLKMIYFITTHKQDYDFGNELTTMYNWDEKVSYYLRQLPDDFPYSDDYVRTVTTAVCQRVIAVKQYDDTGLNVEDLTLIRPSQELVKGMDEDYDLKKYSNHPVRVHFIDGDHLTMLENTELAKILNGKLRKCEQTQRHGCS